MLERVSPFSTALLVASSASAVLLFGGRALAEDADHDGLDDALEDRLAERFAPIVIHSSLETNLPTKVEPFLARTTLAFYDEACPHARRVTPVAAAPTEDGLLGRVVETTCGGGRTRVTSDGYRSDRKTRTFFLSDVDDETKEGSRDTRDWRTYVHVYPNDRGGVTLQFWRFYAFNRAFASHGGDWEGVHVVLDRDERAVEVGLLGHRTLDEHDPRDLAWEGTHPVVFSEIGGHSSRTSGADIPAEGCVDSGVCAVDRSDLRTFFRQETWTGGQVVWPSGRVTVGGGLLNVGERSAPLHGQSFLRYSGLWGSPGHFYATSGYWGPAFNETSMRPDGYVTAWCRGMTLPLKVARECFGVAAE
jgi:hypothetical protein